MALNIKVYKFILTIYVFDIQYIMQYGEGYVYLTSTFFYGFHPLVKKENKTCGPNFIVSVSVSHCPLRWYCLFM